MLHEERTIAGRGLLSLPFLLSLALGAHAATVNVGGKLGWVIQQYPTLSVAVGDTLNFTWPQSPRPSDIFHDVWQLPNASAWAACDFSAATQQGTNKVFIPVGQPGVTYYACGVLGGVHCLLGQKVKVVATGAARRPPPTRSPPPSRPRRPPPPPPPAPKYVNIGGAEGWVIKRYPNLTVTVGSTLNFTWPQSSRPTDLFHNVWRFSNEKAWAACNFTGGTFLGVNKIFLPVQRAGVSFYGCSVLLGAHCRVGQKVKVTAVAPAPSPPPLPRPPPPAPARKYVNVGGDKGWVVQKYLPIRVGVGATLNFTWPQGGGQIGDVFHNVYKFPNKRAFDSCNFLKARLLGQNRVFVNLTAAGESYFGCAVLRGLHCRAGQKVAVIATSTSTIKK